MCRARTWMLDHSGSCVSYCACSWCFCRPVLNWKSEITSDVVDNEDCSLHGVEQCAAKHSSWTVSCLSAALAKEVKFKVWNRDIWYNAAYISNTGDWVEFTVTKLWRNWGLIGTSSCYCGTLCTDSTSGQSSPQCTYRHTTAAMSHTRPLLSSLH